jgi:hypothetical protein
MIDGLPQGVRSQVYRRIVEQLKTDPTLANVIKVWDVNLCEPSPQSVVTASPILRLTPLLGPVGWYSPDAQFGPLQIRYEIGVQTNDVNDLLDIQEVVERAIYPFNDRAKQLAFEKALVDLKAETGQITFSQPASVQREENGSFYCVGMMQIDVIRPFNP